MPRYLVTDTLLQVDADTEDQAIEYACRFLEAHGIHLDDETNDEHVVWVNAPEYADERPDLIPPTRG